MPHALPASRPSRRIVALLLALLAIGAVGLASAPVPASAQLIDNTPRTKDEARAARDAADSADGGGGLSLAAWLTIAAVIAIGGATFLILRDSSHSSGPTEERRAAPIRKDVDPKSARGVPKAMFESEGSDASRAVSRTKKRAKGKRQKQARRANRPRR